MNNQIKQENSAALPPGLVDREVEIADFVSLIRLIRSNMPISYNLIEWYGEPGIGKTTLLNLYIEKCNNLKVAHFSINLRDDEQQDKFLADPSLLLEKIAKEIAPLNQSTFVSFHSAINDFRAEANTTEIVKQYYSLSYEERLYQSPVWLHRLRSAAKELVNCLDSLATTDMKLWRPAVLLFDEADHCNTSLLDWIEEFIVVPFIAKKYFVVVWADRRPWRWKKPELQNRRQTRKLTGFDEANTRKQIQKNTDNPSLAEELFSTVFDITRGHPFAISVAIDEINSRNITEGNIVSAIFNKVILNYAFQGLEDHQKIALQHLALVRLFDTSMIKEILQRCAVDIFPVEIKHEEFNLLLQQLTTTQLITWHNNSYSIIPDLRHLIREYYLIEPMARDKFIAVNKAALEVYKRRIERSYVDIPGAILEEIYHCASLAQTGQPCIILDVVKEHLGKIFENHLENDARRNALEGFRNRIDNDLELAELINHQVLTGLRDLIDKQLSEISD